MTAAAPGGPGGPAGPAGRGAGSGAPRGSAAELGLPPDGPGSPATFGPRIGALAVDCIASALVAALVLSFLPRRNDLPGAASALPGSWSLVPLAVLYVVGLLVTGQTLGMYLLRLRVVAVAPGRAPRRVGFGAVLVRTLLLFLFVPAVIFDKLGRGLHDRVAGTVVVRL